jgi:pimeloyl-ACP methyl ester carboxylesterase
VARESFLVDITEVRLAGWKDGSGRPVLLLHGGPGLSFEYLDALGGELGDEYEVAAFQQRGLAPSSTEGPFTVGDHVADVGRVLNALGWERATIVGHSWGGHLALHVALAHSERLHGVLIVDPLGGVGDGGGAAFDAEMFARTPADVRDRARELDALMMRGDGTEEMAAESMRLVWASYFADPAAAPPMPEIRFSLPCMGGTFASIAEELPALEARLPTIGVPVGFVHGERSPMPSTASTDTAACIPGAWVEIVPGAGHFPWLEAPGSVRQALARLLTAS